MTKEEKILTASEYLSQQAELEKDALEILPHSCTQCTFPKALRQMVYTCMTCFAKEVNPFGFCYACSIVCHTEHEVIELGVKRGFRCDCPLIQNTCQLDATNTTTTTNTSDSKHKNQYDQNFSGRFCYCHSTYEPESDQRVLFQCDLCQDWFHDSCIGKCPDDEDAFIDFVCRQCTKKHDFLFSYSQDFYCMSFSQLLKTATGKEKQYKRVEGRSEKCKLKDYEMPPVPVAVFTKLDLCELLCQCEDCMKMYNEKHLLFIFNDEPIYEPEMEQQQSSLYEAGLNAFSQLDSDQQSRGILAYHKLKTEMKAFLSPFVNQQKIVTKEDVVSAFNKKRKIID